MSEQRIPATERHAELVEVAARATEDHYFELVEQPSGRQWARCSCGWAGPDTIGRAGALSQWLPHRDRILLAAVGDALRQEGAAAERVRVVEGLVATIKALIDKNDALVHRATDTAQYELADQAEAVARALRDVLAVVEAAREDTT